ncbi:MAG: AAA family ATPase [Candidatus Saccharimonadales bacterium]
MRTESEYEEFEKKRAESSSKVLDSDSKKIIVMAGPGTGKSYLFQQLAKKYRSNGKTNIIVLSFINELVKDLTVDMHGLAEVSTLHSFAAKQLRLTQSMYMRLRDVIEEDMANNTGQRKDFGVILDEMIVSETEAIEYMRLRRAYYERIDPSGSVFDLVNHYRAHPELIPSYDLVLVDEYQDFNLLEVALVNELAKKSSIVIAGDDDQSLYSFKHSVPENIRAIHNGEDYESFELPYCSRSTEVVLNAFHDVVNKAKSEGYLSKRIEKQYLYFPTAKKDTLSNLYPKISVRLNTQQAQCAFYIDKEIGEVFEKDPGFSVLVICPLKSQISKVCQMLRKKGYKNVTGDQRSSEGNDVLLDGLSTLVETPEANIGWRQCAKALLSANDFNDALQRTSDNTTRFSDVLSPAFRSEVNKLRSICAKIKEGQTLTQDQKTLIFDKLGIDIEKLGEENARDKLFSRTSNKVQHEIKIKVTTILGSKGLSYDHVFLINFDDRYICNGDLNDEKINMFLVALTRSKNKVNIYSSQARDPLLISWIGSNRKVYIH